MSTKNGPRSARRRSTRRPARARRRSARSQSLDPGVATGRRRGPRCLHSTAPRGGRCPPRRRRRDRPARRGDRRDCSPTSGSRRGCARPRRRRCRRSSSRPVRLQADEPAELLSQDVPESRVRVETDRHVGTASPVQRDVAAPSRRRRRPARMTEGLPQIVPGCRARAARPRPSCRRTAARRGSSRTAGLVPRDPPRRRRGRPPGRRPAARVVEAAHDDRARRLGGRSAACERADQGKAPGSS